MILELQLKFKDGYCSLHCDDLPGLNLFGKRPENVLADFIPAWRKMHEVSPKQVMPVPSCRGYVPTRKKGGYARAAKLSPERRKEIAKKAAKKRWKIGGDSK